MKEGRDHWLHDVMAQERAYCPPEPMDSEVPSTTFLHPLLLAISCLPSLALSLTLTHTQDPLFYLHTSGSTGKPKGLVHTTGGYLVYASLTHKIVFDYKPGDVYACMADIGYEPY